SPHGFDLAEDRLDDVLAGRVRGLAGCRPEFLLHLLLHTRLSRGRRRIGRDRRLMVLLTFDREARGHPDLPHTRARLLSEVPGVGRVGDRHGGTVSRLGPLDPGCRQVLEVCLRLWVRTMRRSWTLGGRAGPRTSAWACHQWATARSRPT